MLKQALEVFKQEYERYGDKLILDGYLPAEGTYVIVEDHGTQFDVKEKIHIKYDKKNKNLDHSIDDMGFLCIADYNSKLLDMNKPIGSQKIIHSNNYLSFFVKKESFFNGKLSKEIIESYYSALEDPKSKYEKKKALQLYSVVENEIGKVEREKIGRIREWILSHVFDLGREEQGKDYFKIFFQSPKEDFLKEGKRYFALNLYNSNDYNETIEGVIYGVSNHNMGLNAKKPYLENKGRKTAAPYMVDVDEIQLQKKLFDYLMNFAEAGKPNIYISDKIEAYSNGESPDENFSGMYLRIKKGKELEILDQDIIAQYRPLLISGFEYKNYLHIDYEKLNGEYHGYKRMKDMQKLINEVFFNKFLLPNYFTDSKEMSIPNDNLFKNILIARAALFEWFYKGNDVGIWDVLEPVSFDLILGSIENGYMTKAADQLNLRLSLKEYFQKGEQMASFISDARERLRMKMNKKENDGTYHDIESDEEYFFAVGQLVSYLITKSKSKRNPNEVINQFITMNDDEKIKTKVRQLYQKYNYDLYGMRINNLLALVMGYRPKGKINGDIIMFGAVHQNLMFEKVKEEN